MYKVRLRVLERCHYSSRRPWRIRYRDKGVVGRRIGKRTISSTMRSHLIQLPFKQIKWFLCLACAQIKFSRSCENVGSKSEITGVPAAVREVNDEVTKRPPFLRPRRDNVDVGDISTAALFTWSSLQTMPDIKSVSFPHPRLTIQQLSDVLRHFVFTRLLNWQVFLA